MRQETNRITLSSCLLPDVAEHFTEFYPIESRDMGLNYELFVDITLRKYAEGLKLPLPENDPSPTLRYLVIPKDRCSLTRPVKCTIVFVTKFMS